MELPWKKYYDGTDASSEEEKLMKEYGTFLYKKYLFIIICTIGAIVVAGFATTIGPYQIGFFESFKIIFEHIFGNIQDSTKDYVIWDVRLPRIVAGIVAGAGLAIAGATMQSTMKNPLADPYTTGISAGAAFGATLSIVLGLSIINGNFTIILNAFVFSLIPMGVILLISTVKQASPTVIILSGLAVMYLFNAMTTVMMLMANPNALAEAFTWQIGTLGMAKWSSIPIMFIVTLIGGIALQLLSGKINVLMSGDESARSLGINADKLRIIGLLIVSLMAATIVSFTGIIGFVGLVCPHICRMFVGSDNKFLLPSSAAFGAVFLIVADLVGRTIISPTILQVGVITAFIGGPVLLYLLIRQKKEAW